MRPKHPLTFMYHGIVPAQPGHGNVELRVVYQPDFERHLRFVKRYFRVLHPEEFADALERKQPLPRRAALVTLDDGFQNLLDYALPVAESVSIPLLAFVSSGHLDGGEWLWFARAHLLRRMGGSTADLQARLPAARLADIDAFLDQAGAPRRATAQPLHRMLYDGANSAGLAAAVARGFLVLGGHTINHPILPSEDAEVCTREITQNKRDIERITGRPVRLFAYPAGMLNASVARVVRASGYVGAFSILPPARSFPREFLHYHLPRTGIFSSDRLTFALKCANVDYWRWRFGLRK